MTWTWNDVSVPTRVKSPSQHQIPPVIPPSPVPPKSANDEAADPRIPSRESRPQELKARDAAKRTPPLVPEPHVVTAREYNGRSRPQPREWNPEHPVWRARREARGSDAPASGGSFTSDAKPDLYADARPPRPVGNPEHLARKKTEETQNMWFIMTGSTRAVKGETLL